ncbi:MAG: DNA/RNA nuclease SfsA, partial [Methanomicrobiales archaeon]|nr:DNA/RNA nuclease SfsA [Methanomicrobiales archaeon]
GFISLHGYLSGYAEGRQMEFPGRLVKGTFLSRPNRFLGTVRVRGEEAGCFIANPGRLRELLRPGATVWLREAASPERKTRWDLVLVRHGDLLVSVDTRVVNQTGFSLVENHPGRSPGGDRLVPEAIRSEAIPSLRGLGIVKAEHPFLDSRLDFLARDTEGPVLLEAKSCTLVKGGVALFPDAPTARGTRHLSTLAAAARGGTRAMVVMVIQREDGEAFTPNAGLDPAFGKAFREALSMGVQACAFTCRIGRTGITPYREVPVILR